MYFVERGGMDGGRGEGGGGGRGRGMGGGLDENGIEECERHV